MTMLCDSCHNNQASVFMGHHFGGEKVEVRLCADCAREKMENSDLAVALGEALGAPLEEIMRDLMSQLPEDFQSAGPGLAVDGLIFGLSKSMGQPFGENEEMETGDSEEDDLNALLGEPNSPLFDALLQTGHQNPARRCPKCAITWDRLRQDGRAGCAQCYETFAAELGEVMQRMQHGIKHSGKHPRAAGKRIRHQELVRVKNSNRLEMLNTRLQEAVAEERYEEAAKLRDQIKAVVGT